MFPSARLAAVGWGRLGSGSSVPLERVLEEFHAPGMERRRDGQREGGMRAVEGSPPQHPETEPGSAGPPWARTQLRSRPVWSSPLGRDGDLRGWGCCRAQRESWQGPQRAAELAVDAGGFLPTQPLQNQLLVEGDGLQLADPLAPGRPLHGGALFIPWGWTALGFAALLGVAQTTSDFALDKGFPSVKPHLIKCRKGRAGISLSLTDVNVSLTILGNFAAFGSASPAVSLLTHQRFYTGKHNSASQCQVVSGCPGPCADLPPQSGDIPPSGDILLAWMGGTSPVTAVQPCWIGDWGSWPCPDSAFLLHSS